MVWPVFIYALFLFWTVVVVPYESLGPEITFDYNDRTSPFAMRDGFLIAGTLAAASSPALVQWLFSLSNDASGERQKFFWISIFYAPLIVATCWWCVLSIKELPRRETRDPCQSLAGAAPSDPEPSLLNSTGGLHHQCGR